MEREQLERYWSQKEEIEELRYKLNHLGAGDSLIGNDVIFDYSTGFPRPQAVIGYDYDKENRLRNTYTRQIEKLGKDCEETEQWIEAIPDSLTRRIFRMYFIEGMNQQQMGRKLHMDQSNISKKISNYLKME